MSFSLVIRTHSSRGDDASAPFSSMPELFVVAARRSVPHRAHRLSGQWIDPVHGRRSPRSIVLDMDSSVSPTHGEQEGTAYNGRAGDLDIVGDGDAAASAPPCGFRAPRLEARPVRGLQRLLHRAPVVAAVVGDAHAIGEGQSVRRDQVAAAQLDPVEPERRGGDVDQPLDHEHRLGPPGATVDRCRRGVGQRRMAAEVNGRDAVDALHHRQVTAGPDGGALLARRFSVL
ncbi:MAG: transposase [Enhydrobacter sp.]|nr:transposase [Enhydrobacter sp.]